LKLRKIKENVSIPVFASLNAIYNSTWIEYAKLLEETGIDGLEVNFYRVPVSNEDDANLIESHQLKILQEITSELKIPVSVKLSYFYTNPLDFINKLEKTGAKGIVLFNRFFQPEINIETEEFFFPWELSQKGDYKVTLRFLGLLYGTTNASLIANRGIKTSEDVIKMILAGADAVQMVSAFYENGLPYTTQLLSGIEAWMDKKGYTTLNDFKGKLSKVNMKDDLPYSRAQYVDILKNTGEVMKLYPMR
jgi:dihydroorotate dehydrogenase (fumarate)